MNRNAQITKVTQEILAAFRTGQLAEPLAQTFLNHGLHCERCDANMQGNTRRTGCSVGGMRPDIHYA